MVAGLYHTPLFTMYNCNTVYSKLTFLKLKLHIAKSKTTLNIHTHSGRKVCHQQLVSVNTKNG